MKIPGSDRKNEIKTKKMKNWGPFKTKASKKWHLSKLCLVNKVFFFCFYYFLFVCLFCFVFFVVFCCCCFWQRECLLHIILFLIECWKKLKTINKKLLQKNTVKQTHVFLLHTLLTFVISICFNSWKSLESWNYGLT